NAEIADPAPILKLPFIADADPILLENGLRDKAVELGFINPRRNNIQNKSPANTGNGSSNLHTHMRKITVRTSCMREVFRVSSTTSKRFRRYLLSWLPAIKPKAFIPNIHPKVDSETP